MRPMLRLFVVLIAPVTTVRVGAADFNWQGHGAISLDVVPGWKLQHKPAGDVGYYFIARSSSRNQAAIQITVIETPPDKPVKAGDIVNLLNGAAQVYLPGSVEKRVEPHGMLLAQGSGCWAQFTDAALVGRPTVPGDYKITRSAIIALDEHTVAAATMQFDVPNGSEPSAMLAMLSSLRFVQGRTVAEAPPESGDSGFEFTVPGSALLLHIALTGMEEDNLRTGGGTDQPGYFRISRAKPNLVISGWFEPDGKYSGLMKFWNGEAATMATNGLPQPRNVMFSRQGKWEFVSYDVVMAGATFCHVRAELKQSGTWIDLHLSMTATGSPVEARAELLAALGNVEVRMK